MSEAKIKGVEALEFIRNFDNFKEEDVKTTVTGNPVLEFYLSSYESTQTINGFVYKNYSNSKTNAKVRIVQNYIGMVDQANTILREICFEDIKGFDSGNPEIYLEFDDWRSTKADLRFTLSDNDEEIIFKEIPLKKQDQKHDEQHILSMIKNLIDNDNLYKGWIQLGDKYNGLLTLECDYRQGSAYQEDGPTSEFIDSKGHTLFVEMPYFFDRHTFDLDLTKIYNIRFTGNKKYYYNDYVGYDRYYYEYELRGNGKAEITNIKIYSCYQVIKLNAPYTVYRKDDK